MHAKKICMLGAFSVGKSSLVKSFVHSIFSEKYHTTIGVKIDKKKIIVNEEPINLIIWDIEGVDIFTELNTSFLRGASGIALVIDGTRPNTLDTAQNILDIVGETLGETNTVILINKSDLKKKWLIKEANIENLPVTSDDIFYTSAKSGENVEKAFQHLADMIMLSHAVE